MVFPRYRGYYMPASGYEFSSAQLDISQVGHKKIEFISTSGHVIFCLLFKHTNNDVFDDFPKMSDYFPTISENFPKLFRRLVERFQTFSEHFTRESSPGISLVFI